LDLKYALAKIGFSLKKEESELLFLSKNRKQKSVICNSNAIGTYWGIWCYYSQGGYNVKSYSFISEKLDANKEMLLLKRAASRWIVKMF